MLVGIDHFPMFFNYERLAWLFGALLLRRSNTSTGKILQNMKTYLFIIARFKDVNNKKWFWLARTTHQLFLTRSKDAFDNHLFGTETNFMSRRMHLISVCNVTLSRHQNSTHFKFAYYSL